MKSKQNPSQLLETAAEKYPRGVTFQSPITNKALRGFFTHISTGQFTAYQPEFCMPDHTNSIWRLDDTGIPVGLVYNGQIDEWAEILKR